MADVPAHFFRQSAVLPYRWLRGRRLQVLLITSRRRTRWVLPKGVQEPGIEASESAAKEALEEAGVEGETDRVPIGSYEYSKWRGTCHVLVFPMAVHEVHEHWQESERDRCWLSPEQAAERVDEPQLKKLIRRFAREMSRGH